MLPGVVAAGEDVGAEVEQIVGRLGRGAEPAGGVLGVDHHDVDGVLLAQRGQQRAQRIAPRPSDDVADAED